MSWFKFQTLRNYTFSHPPIKLCISFVLVSNSIVIADFGDFSGDMNTFQLSNVGVTTWFHAGANSANTGADTANNASTSSSSMNQMAAKGFTPRLFSLSPCSLFLCLSFSLSFATFSMNFFRIYIVNKHYAQSLSSLNSQNISNRFVFLFQLLVHKQIFTCI